MRSRQLRFSTSPAATIMNFLLTNDDGIDAPGLELLRSVVAERATVVVVAPDRPVSSCGHSVTTDRDLTLLPRGAGCFALDGMPADCTRVGLQHVCPAADWVLSGVNDGGNLGVDVYLSGTVAAAREAALLGRPAIAFSQYRRGRGPKDWSPLIPHLKRVLDLLTSQPVGHAVLWNVNFPAIEDLHEATAIVRCPPEPDHLPVRFQSANNVFRYRGLYAERPRRPGSDVDVCFSGGIAVTQLPLL